MFRGFRYRLYPTDAQEEKLREYASVCRFLFNLALEHRQTYRHLYAANGFRLNYRQQSKELTQLRAEVGWIRDVPRWCEEQALRDLDAAFAAFFAGRGRYPQYRKRGTRESFRFHARDCAITAINGKWSAVHVPGIGRVRFRDTRPRRGTTKNVNISADALGWHVSFGCEIEHTPPASDLPSIGIDRGVTNTLAFSSGELLSVPTNLAALERRHRRAQHVVSRRQRGSARRAKALRRAAALAARCCRIRRDWHHKTSRMIAERFGTVVMEDLVVRGMTAKGRGKRGLNRSILSQGWSMFARLVAYKLEERGGTLALVNPAYTSQTCAECGVIDKANRESQAVFKCQHCGHEAHADVNAAINILRGNTSATGVEGPHRRPDEALTQAAA